MAGVRLPTHVSSFSLLTLPRRLCWIVPAAKHGRLNGTSDDGEKKGSSTSFTQESPRNVVNSVGDGRRRDAERQF